MMGFTIVDWATEEYIREEAERMKKQTFAQRLHKYVYDGWDDYRLATDEEWKIFCERIKKIAKEYE